MIDEQQSALFEERAENLSPEHFVAWTAPTPHDSHVIRQLINQGPKLLSGPRGCGKTTLLLRAAAEIGKRGIALPLYINYGRSMFIEPAFNRRADADAFFQDWLAAKVLESVGKVLRQERIDLPQAASLADDAKRFIASAERDSNAARPDIPGPSVLSQKLEQWSRQLGFDRVILLLDDAAHAFVPQQQRIFFDFLRNVRTPAVTFKAAIYPGVTEFSPSFHVGHDAKIVKAWIAVEGPEYLPFMESIFERRITGKLRDAISTDVAKLFAGASFGIPRTFFSMIEAFLDAGSVRSAVLTRTANTIISEHSDQLRVLHRSLATKLPRYREYVTTGETVLDKILDEIRTLNEARIRRNSTQALDIAIRHPIDPRLTTILGLLEYAGLVRQTNESVSLGDQGTYSKYAVHGCLLYSSSSIKYGKNPTLLQRAESLVRTARTGSFKRIGADALLTAEEAEACQLVVANCQNCGAPRVLEDALFCSRCGAELVNASRLEELLNASVDFLPLTPRKLEALHSQGLNTVEDIIRDRGLSEISKAWHVGPVWARRIYSLAEEFVGV